MDFLPHLVFFLKKINHCNSMDVSKLSKHEFFVLCVIFLSVFFFFFPSHIPGNLCNFPTHTPQQNDVFKSKHKHIVDTGLALLSHMLKWTLVTGYNPSIVLFIS